ncbi:hypothetical protein P4O66_004931 [Electrophorus voltai]|uniref:Uncharacterized protein n=1 Tax=Electrophorus voltai TaxID=2609070 RepID=A0AAD9E6N8_9TELE|nr:uncharacterized protein LOC113579559 [Electrophorus electricus]KAK1806418.1 hypothetical protein P4O66_004931 [Electrophorus voltai]
MNLSQSKDIVSLLQNEDDAAVIETAVRTAVLSILKVFFDMNNKRTRSYQVKLADMEKENTALRLELKAAEQELQTLRQFTSSSDSYKISADVIFSPEFDNNFTTDVDREEAATSQNVSGNDTLLQTSDNRSLKEEPSYDDTLYIKNELQEESSPADCDYHVIPYLGWTTSGQTQQPAVPIQRCGACHSSNHSVQEDDASVPSLEKKRLSSRERVRRYRARIRADPEKYLAWKEKDRLRYRRRSKSIQELSEPMKKLKRKAWREATRRHRARKLAQANFTPPHATQTANL